MFIFAAIKAFLPSIPWQVWIAVLALAVVLVTGIHLKHKWQADAARQATETINDANTKSEERADKSSLSVDDCYSVGGQWDRSRGLCITAGSGK